MVQTRDLQQNPRRGLAAFEAKARRNRPSGANLVDRSDPRMWQKPVVRQTSAVSLKEEKSPEAQTKAEQDPEDAMRVHQLCPVCESTVMSIRCKLVCPNCHSIVQTCCD